MTIKGPFIRFTQLIGKVFRLLVVLLMLFSSLLQLNIQSVNAADDPTPTVDDSTTEEPAEEPAEPPEDDPTETPTETPLETPEETSVEEPTKVPTEVPEEESSVSTPTITIIGSLEPFNKAVGLPSAEQSYTISGSFLESDIIVTAPADFEISKTTGIGFTSSLTFTPTDGMLAESAIFVRMNSTLATDYAAIIIHTSDGAETVSLDVTGSSVPKIILTGDLQVFSTEVGMVSEEQSYSVSAVNLTEDVLITASEYFQISSDGVYGQTVNLTPDEDVIIDVPITVVFQSDEAGEFSGSLTHTSANAETVQVDVSGSATEGVIKAQATSITFTAEELLGCPEDDSITINIVPDSTIEYRYQYGTSSGSYSDTTSTYTATGGEPHEVVISGLSANTEYYYRMQYHLPGETDWVDRTEHSFWTQRAEGSSFSFTVTSDIHAQLNTMLSNAMTNIYNADPDFEIDLGDTFMVDGTTSQSAVDNKYLAFRDSSYFDKIGGSVPIFIMPGNHEEEEGWNLDDTPFSIGVADIQARKAYYPTPINGDFYTGNTDTLSDIDAGTYGDQYREDYYAWTWGDALFVVIDPFQYTMNLPYAPGMAGEGNDDVQDGDQWSWTLGAEQFQWFKQTLEGSDAKYKFVFSHQMVGGIPDESVSGGAGYVRGGAEASAYFEWGGKNADGSEGFATQRDSGDFGTVPIHQLMVANGVSAYFHGHDHQYVYEKTHDGIVYQEMPQTSTTSSGFGGIYIEGEYDTFDTIKKMSSGGHLLITVTPSEATVDYISSSSTSGTVNYSYTILPATEDTTPPTVTIDQADGQDDPTSSSTINFDVAFSESVSDFETGDITLNGTAGATTAEVTGSGTTYNVAVNGMTTSGTVVADIAADVAHDAAGNPNEVSTSTDNSVTYDASTSTGEVTLDGSVSTGTTDDESSISVSHTTGTGDNRLMLVGASWNCGSNARAITSVTFTYGSEVLNLSEEIVQESGSTSRRYASIWYSETEPPQNTSGTLTVTFDGTVSNGIVVGVANFAGVDQTTPLTVSNGANSSSTGSTQSVILESLAGNELVFDTLFIGVSGTPTDPTVGDDQTQLWTDTEANARGVASMEQASSSTVTMSWSTGSTSVVWALAAVAIKPAAAGTTYDLTMGVSPEGGGTTTPAAGTYSYAEDTVVDITATPADGYEFVNWTGDVADANLASTTVTMNGDKTVTANFAAIEYTLTIVSEHGTVTKDPDQSTYHYGDVVQLTATPGEGYTFLDWTGDLNSSDNPVSIVISGNHTVTANYTEITGVVALDGSVSTGITDDESSISVSHTTGTGANRLMLVGVSWNCGSNARAITSVTFTYGSEVLNLSEEITQESESTDDRFTSIWYSPTEPPQNTSGTLTVTFDGTVSNGVVVGVANFTGVNLTDLFTTSGGAASGSSDETQSITLESLAGNELVFDTLFIGVGGTPTDPTVGDDQTQLWTDTEANARGVASIEQASSSTVTMSWSTGSTSVVWALAAVAIKPAAAGTTYDLTMGVSPEGGGTTTPAAGTYSYAEDTVVDITATPADGYEFVNWTGDVADVNSAITTVTMNGDKTVTANFAAIEYTLTIVSEHGTVTKDPDQSTYHYGDVVQLTATPGEGYTFLDWTGDLSSSDNPVSIVISGNHTVTANYTEITGVVTLDGSISTGTVDSDSSVSVGHTTGAGANRLMLVGVSWNCGSNARAITSVTFTYGSEVLNLSEEITQESESTDDRFASIWYSPTEPPAGTTGTLTVTFDGTVSNGVVVGVANFTGVNQTTPLTVSNGANSSSASSTQSVTLESLTGNELVFDTLFIGVNTSSPTDPTVGADQTQLWTDTESNARGVASIEQASGSTVTMSWSTGSTTVVWALAAVAIKPAPLGTTYDLTMGVSPEGGGTTTPAVGTYSYEEDAVVNITATPADGYEFVNWTGDVADVNSASTTVTMDGDKTVTANFAAIEYTLTIVSEHGTVTKDPDQSTYHYGDVVQLTATPSVGYNFVNWTGDLTSSDNPASLTISGDHTVTANYEMVIVTFTGTELLGRPEANSIAINIVPDVDISLYYEYGTTSGTYTDATSAVSATGGEPQVVTISGLTANTKYYYRMQYSVDGGSTWVARSENSFHTQRAPGSTFTFTITTDGHVNIMLGDEATWIETFNDVKADQADFDIDLGDSVAMDNGDVSIDIGDVAAAEQKYKDTLPVYNIVSGSTPIFFLPGNHEQQEAWHLLEPLSGSLPVMGKNAEKKFFLNPVPDSFYSGDTGTYSYLDGDQLRQAYYAWTWGDALFVVINPYWFTTTKPYTTLVGGGEDDTVGSDDRWDWTLGQEQYEWLKTTLENSSAEYKFIFSHQIVGGNSLSNPDQVNYGHGGVDSAHLVEWGGYNVDGTTWGWDTERAGWGSMPIHQIMVANGVTAFFHAHDHQYAYEMLDGIVYQAVPPTSFSTNFGIYTTGGNDGKTIQALEGPGHLKVTVGPDETQVDYIRTGETTSAYTYTMEPGTANHNLTMAVSPSEGGTTSPAVGVHSYAEDTVVEITAEPAEGYVFIDWTGDVADPNSASTTVTMDEDKTVTANFYLNSAPVITEGDSVDVDMSKNGVPTAFELTLHASDVDTSDTLTWSIGTQATHGTAGASGTGTSQVVDYTPETDYVGDDSFVVEVSDDHEGTDSITVNVHISEVLYTISGNAGVAGATLTYTGGSTEANSSGDYSISVAYDWSGTVTPSLSGYLFTPESRSYSNVLADISGEDYAAVATGSQDIGLVEGWNLVSFRIAPTSTLIEDVLASVDGNYGLVYAWDASNEENGWLKYDPNGEGYANSLLNLDESMGFWINMTAADTLTVSGTLPSSTDIALLDNAGGWNLVGYPSDTSGTLPEILADHGVGTDFSLVYAYEASDLVDPWKKFDRTGAAYANDLTSLTSGYGHWIEVSGDSTWSVTY